MIRKYSTRRYEEVRDCLAAAPGHLTAAEVFQRLSGNGTISKATVYRQLERLVEEGVAVRATPEGERTACYEIVRTDECHEGACYHLKCEGCGKLIHLGCEEVDALRDHMLREHGFEVDSRRTVIFGLCPDCRASEADRDR